MGLDISGPFFENSALRLVQGTVRAEDRSCPGLLAYLLEQGANPNSQKNDECK